MNIGQIKVWAWASAAVLTIGLSAYVYRFVRNLPELEKGVDVKFVDETLRSVPPLSVQSDKLLAYEQAKKVIAVVDWTGMPKPVEQPKEANPGPVTKLATPVKDFVKVVSIMCAVGEPERSFIQVHYLPPAGSAVPTAVLHVGDPLSAQHTDITVEKIDPGVVTFRFAEEGREPETLSCAEFDAKSEIVIIGDDGVIIEPIKSTTIPRSSEAFIPGKSISIGRNRIRLGSEDMKTFNDDYSRILGNEVQTAQHRDPKTGKYDGIEIKSILPGSIVERHGAQVGDVVKSINGHPVNTTNEAITFVKTNKDKYSTWEVVIENKGKTRTVTYESGGN